jgi:catechol 2,3-dioxygenase-like lactoylglutathione lyase family enzyme
MSQPRMTLSGIVLDSPDAQELSAFYRRLLGWSVEADEPDWVKLSSPDGGPGLSFQTEKNYQPPVWPSGPGGRQMQVFLDPAGHPFCLFLPGT